MSSSVKEMFSFHPTEIPNDPNKPKETIKVGYGTFKDGSVTLSAGPWGPFTGSTSKDTLLFGKPLGMKHEHFFLNLLCWQFSRFSEHSESVNSEIRGNSGYSISKREVTQT